MGRILTNIYGLPEPFVRAVKNEKYVKRGDISITQIIDAPRVRLLKRVHTYEEDVSATVWSLFGSGVHTVIERSSENHDDAIPEIAMTMKVDGWEVTGTCDLYEKSLKKLTDWKVTSVWKVLKGLSNDDGWVKQTNCYASMLRNPDVVKVIDGVETKEAFEVNEINIICILKDWKSREAKYNRDYPQTPVVKIKVPIFSQEGMINYIAKRVEAHKSEEQKFYLDAAPGEPYKEDALAFCTDSERWNVAPTWKMKTKSKKNSLKNFTIKNKSDEEGAIAWHANKLIEYPDLVIEKHAGEDKRCSEYCPVNVHCSYWQLVKHRYE